MKIWLCSIPQIKSPPSRTLSRKVQRFQSACVWTQLAPTDSASSEIDKNLWATVKYFMYILNKTSLNTEDAIFQKGNKANAACFMFLYIYLIIRSSAMLEKAKELLVLSN